MNNVVNLNPPTVNAPQNMGIDQGGGPPHDGAMEARIAVLEQIAKDTKDVLKEIKDDLREVKRDQRSDFRMVFGALIAGAIGLATLMAHGFHWF